MRPATLKPTLLRAPKLWRGKLLIRPYVEEVKFVSGLEYSARIQQAGESFFFPLGTDDPVEASKRASRIQALVRQQGWSAARQVYPHEFTFAIFWSASPLTCTYSSLYSIPSKLPRRWQTHPPSSQPRCRVTVVHREEPLGKSIAFWLNRQPGFACLGNFTSFSEAARALPSGQTDVWLVDRHSIEPSGGATRELISQTLPAATVFDFGIFAESNFIFHSVTGVKTGYILCRRPPVRLLEPIQSLSQNTRMPKPVLEQKIQSHFQALFTNETKAHGEASATTLTQREEQVLKALSQGLSEKQVASRLHISSQTVHNHAKKIYTKFGAHSRTEVVVKYLGLGKSLLP